MTLKLCCNSSIFFYYFFLTAGGPDELTQRSGKVKVETSENLGLNLQVSILGGRLRRCPLIWGCWLQGSSFWFFLIAVRVCSPYLMLHLSVLTIIMVGGCRGGGGGYITMMNPIFDFLMGVAHLLNPTLSI